MAAWLWRGGAKTLSICFIGTICLSAFLSTPARSAEGATCEEVLQEIFVEHWGLPVSDERASLQVLSDRCKGAHGMALGRDQPGRLMTLKGLLDYAAGRDKSAAEAWERGAEQGDPLSMIALADAYGFDFEAGGDFDQRLEAAFGLYRKAAEAGSTLGMTKVAWYYDRGYHVEESPERALGWYMRAAGEAEPLAMYNVGLFFEKGRGIEQDIENAMRWYEWAGNAGEVTGFLSLGILYDNGIHVPEDDAKAVYYYRAAAYGGHTGAMLNLGWMYRHGAGIERDYSEAIYWYERAIDLGETRAASNLGVMYHEGLGVQQNSEKALDYFVLAAEEGSPEGMANAGMIYMERGAFPEAYFWTILATANGFTDVLFRALELQQLLSDDVMAAIETHADIWEPGMRQPDLTSLRR